MQWQICWQTYIERAHRAKVILLWQILRNRNEVDNHIYEVCESTCHECSAKYEDENCKVDSGVEKADLIIMTDSKHKEITKEEENLTIRGPQYENEFWKGHGSQ